LSFVVGLMDGFDGKLARVKGMTTRVGAMEHSFDLLFEFSWLVALGYHMSQSHGSTAILVATMTIVLTAFYPRPLRAVLPSRRRAAEPLQRRDPLLCPTGCAFLRSRNDVYSCHDDVGGLRMAVAAAPQRYGRNTRYTCMNNAQQ
jgi:hypothetical protein